MSENQKEKDSIDVEREEKKKCLQGEWKGEETGKRREGEEVKEEKERQVER